MEDVNFQEQLKLGQDGEEKVFNYLNSLEDTVEVINCTGHKRFQSWGVDGFLVEDKKQLRGTFFDVKTDYQYHRSGKLFIEIMADTNMNKKGGIQSTKANIFYYYDPFGGHLFELPIYAMQRWYDRIGISMNHIEKVNQYNQKTTGVLVSPDDLAIEGISIITENIGPLKYV